MFRTAAVTVTTTPTLIRTTEDADETVLVVNNGISTVYLGDDSVTTAVGVPLPQDASIRLSLTVHSKIYGVVASGTSDVRVGRTRG